MATAAPALAAVGREDEARALSARELAAAAAFGAPRRYGVALSVCGTLDPGPLGLERLGEAVGRLDATTARLDHARALVNLGVGLRERGESAQARTALARGLDIAHGCGAFALAERAREESYAKLGIERRAQLPAALAAAGGAAAVLA